MTGATFTMRFKDVIGSLYGTDPDPYAWDQPFATLSFRNVVYGRLPVLDDYSKIGLGDYPIFDENYRKILNGKIIEEFFNQEIGTESIPMFTMSLRKKMNQIMPFYNQLYKSEQIPYDALSTMSIHSVSNNQINETEAGNAHNASTSSTKTGARVIGSDFPQSMLAADADYASTGSDTNSDVVVNASSDQNSTGTNERNANGDNLVTGFQGAASDLIQKYRNSLLNIDLNVISDIGGHDGCFMLVLNNGDEYFARDTYGW